MTAASQGLEAGSLLEDRAEARLAHRSADPEPLMLASLHCKHPGVRLSWHSALSRRHPGLFGKFPTGADRCTDKHWTNYIQTVKMALKSVNI